MGFGYEKDDVYWCTADPGWVTGTSYGMFAPWSNGLTQVIFEGGYSASKWYSIIQDHNVISGIQPQRQSGCYESWVRTYFKTRYFNFEIYC